VTPFSWPWLVAFAVALLAARAAWRGHRELLGWLGRDPARGARFARAAALAVAAALVAYALGLALRTPERLSGEGADVVIAVDTSNSMDVADVPPTRLRRALRTAERVVEAAKSERLGLVVFAGEAFIALPLTQDRDAVLTYLRALDSDTISVKGSELGRGLAAAGRTFDPRSSRPRTVLLLSDGEDFGPVPDTEIAELHALGARVVAVGYGTEEGGAVPGQAALAEALRAGETTLSQRNDGLLERIAAETDGVYFREIEERPTPAQLLPAADASGAPAPAEPARDPLAPVLVAAALALAAELWLSGGAFALRGRRAPAPAVWQRRRAPAVAAAVAALAIGALGIGGLIAQGDTALADGRAEEALGLYRQAEESRPDDARLEIRIGNALFALGRTDQASGAYLDALRKVDPDDAEARFAAGFNLGNALVAKKHFEEARDAYWSALLAEPNSVEAKWNYEFAAKQIQELPPVPQPDPSAAPKKENDSAGQGGQSQQARRSESRPEKGSLDEHEAERWLDTLDEPISEALRQQVSNATGGKARARPGGRTW
jgi:tetratricopeptide (TPR) repeat protein